MNPTNPIALVAMGGHAFMQKNEAGTIEDHERNSDHISELLLTIVERGYNLIVTHGNGPQVGNLLIQQEQTRDQIPAMPLDVLVAMTEGSLGYVLQQSLLNRLRSLDVKRYVVTVVTQVIVDEDDPAFKEFNKPIGPFLEREEAERRRDEWGWQIRQDPAGRGWRRMVPSPRPQKVIQRHMIRESAERGNIVVAAGGGGIPIRIKPDGNYEGIEAVVDKDLTSSVLACDVRAELLIILTAVPQVFTHFNTPEQSALSAVTVDEIDRLHRAGHFPPGSMGPKIEAAIHFLRHGGRRTLITDPESLPRAFEGRAGTHIIGKL
ncbi:MAG TPA: carbamate kinase [Candidatus Polarisedimenticolaceae bacterium]|nr:carbamate kinase [Candidatus Polarisedimenticolaceae bacterium]